MDIENISPSVLRAIKKTAHDHWKEKRPDKTASDIFVIECYLKAVVSATESNDWTIKHGKITKNETKDI